MRYVIPEVGPEVKQLRPIAHERAQELTPETEVIVLHRGGPVVKDMWDSIVWEVPPGLHRIPYAVAKHLQARAIVPATRNPHSGKAVSQLAIVGLDKPALCQPFTPEELKRFKYAEGLDRSAYERPSQRNAVIIPAQDAIAQAYAAGVDVQSVVKAPASEEARAKPSAVHALAEADAPIAGDEGVDEAPDTDTSGLRPRPRGRR